MADPLYKDFLKRLRKLQYTSAKGGEVWHGESFSIITLMRDELITVLEVAVENDDVVTALQVMLTYVQLVQDSVSVCLSYPHRRNQDELVMETEAFVARFIRELAPQLRMSPLERYTANIYLETIWNHIQVIRPPRK